jgi:serine phosphatase RsbU (regulator of sigma subunit)/putative methionine-R-sulfoxide reductase with GAF domain
MSTSTADATDRLRRLHSVTDAVLARLTLEDLVEELLSRLRETLAADTAMLFLVSDDGRELALRAAQGVDPDVAARTRLAVGTGLAGEIARRGEAIVVDDLASSGIASYILPERGIRCVVGVPLVVEGRVTGVVHVGRTEPRPFDEDDTRLLQLVADHIAVAIDRARLHDEAERAREAAERVADEARAAQDRLALLAMAGDVLMESLAYRQRIQSLAEFVAGRLGDWCGVNLIDDDGSIRRVATAHRDPARTEVVAELVDRAPEKLAAGSSVTVPLVARGRTLGDITFVSETPGRFTDADLLLAKEVARRAALAVDNARLFTAQADVALALQRSLLPPQLPVIPGVDLAARYLAFGEGTEVGGDFYDAFPIGYGAWAVVVGDVCGRGPEAAAVTGLVRHTLRAAALAERRPGRVLRMLNESLRLEFDGDGRFCTACLLQLRPRSPRVRGTVATAGHPLPLVRRADGTVEAVGKGGSLLGVLETPELTSSTIDLDPGDVLVAYTDGVTEARGDGGELFGDTRLIEALSHCGDLDALSVARHIEQEVAAFTGGAPRDDVAIIVARAVG